MYDVWMDRYLFIFILIIIILYGYRLIDIDCYRWKVMEDEVGSMFCWHL